MNIASAWGYSISDGGMDDGGERICNLILRINPEQLGVSHDFADIHLDCVSWPRATAIIGWWTAAGMFLTEYCATQFLAGVKYGMENAQRLGIEIVEEDDEDSS
jgi:hypothetical protein